VRSFPEGIEFTRPDLDGKEKQRCTIALNRSAVKVMNKFFDETHRAMLDCKAAKLKKEFLLPLGDLMFLQIQPDYKNVTILQFYTSDGEPGKLLPGVPGISLKMSEFENLNSVWFELLYCVGYQNAEICHFDDPQTHKSCQKCF